MHDLNSLLLRLADYIDGVRERRAARRRASGEADEIKPENVGPGGVDLSDPKNWGYY